MSVQSYPYTTAGDYTYGGSIQVTGGIASLINTPSTAYAWWHLNENTGTATVDSSGNGRHATTSGTISIGTSIGNGVSGAITYISGGTTSTITWPSGSIPTSFTILSLNRYTGGARFRILKSVTGNWFHGHYTDKRGVCYYEGWKTPQTTIGNLDDWLCCIGKNGGTIPNNILAQEVGKMRLFFLESCDKQNMVFFCW